MDIDRLLSIVARVFFVGAFLLLSLALVENVLNEFEGSLPLVDVFPAQLLNWASVLLFFVIALLLRQIRDAQGGT